MLKLLKFLIKYNKINYVTMLMRFFLHVNLKQVINIYKSSELIELSDTNIS